MNTAARIAQEVERLHRLQEMPDSDNKRINMAQAKRIIAHLENNHLPGGSGFDRGCTVTSYDARAERLVIAAPFHHMDEHGSYDGWEDYVVTVRPSFGSDGIRIDVKGGRKDQREYIGDAVGYALAAHVDEAMPLDVLMGK